MAWMALDFDFVPLVIGILYFAHPGVRIATRMCLENARSSYVLVRFRLVSALLTALLCRLSFVSRGLLKVLLTSGACFHNGFVRIANRSCCRCG